MRALAAFVLSAGACFGQPAFEVASVKPSHDRLGRDFAGPVVFGPDRLSARNVSLKDLIAAAWRVERYQVSGGPRFLDADEFDVDARAGGAVSREQLSVMLQALLAERFHLAAHTEAKEARVYALEVAEGGPKIQPVSDAGAAAAAASSGHFHGDMHRLAELLSVQLSIPAISDPSRPAVATAPVPVVDKTGLAGIYDFAIDLRPELGADMLTLWQRILRDRLGLKLDGQKASVNFVVVDRVDRTPTAQ